MTVEALIRDRRSAQARDIEQASTTAVRTIETAFDTIGAFAAKALRDANQSRPTLQASPALAFAMQALDQLTGSLTGLCEACRGEFYRSGLAHAQRSAPAKFQ